ncbi:MAG: hypothetical protein A2W91_00360 [Bacteroidetes bacterium GWF2_38_335]|nr:MAG: hypothetical protein A2W91_00360 [Bacteroidetes bacterium GWF2_38_335]OFY78285.1 MAG: hypothetical protein A2281_03740 [Bacteroidetes bacterium RIFOXYA12_FULL_38_20]HBS87520.1 hypothetical protein [Bacteroidales bacterium]
MRAFVFLSAILLFLSTAFSQQKPKVYLNNKHEINSVAQSLERDISCSGINVSGNGLSGYDNAVPSENESGIFAATEFYSTGNIQTITFWGFNAYNDGSWGVCSEPGPVSFNIYFTSNSYGVPGDTLLSFEGITPSVSPTAEGNFSGTYPIMQYQVTLPETVELASGMVIIEGTSENNCWFMWLNCSSTGGARYADGAWSTLTRGFAYCMTGTLFNCTAPSDLTVSNVDLNTAEIGWTETGSASSWQFSFGEEGSIPVISTVTDNPHTVTGLVTGETYIAMVRSDCGDGTYSGWAPVSFMAGQCDYEFILGDSYGDGWNECAVRIFDNGIFYKKITLNEGSGTTITIPIVDSHFIEFKWVAGSWANEPSLIVNDPFGNEVYSFASGAGSGFTSGQVIYDFAAYCSPITCFTPTDIFMSNNSAGSAEISWTAVNSETFWVIEYGPEGFSPTGSGITTSSNPYTITGLDIATAYDFYIKANCGSGNYSFWSDPLTFFTDNCLPAEQCNYEFAIIDSYGDGWNGCSINVYENGALIDKVSLESGSSGTQYVAICDAHNLSFRWVTGGWPEECGITVYDPFGETIYSFAPGTANSFSNGQQLLEFVSSCTPPPTCPAPLEIFAEPVGTDFASINWIAGSDETSWIIEYGPAGFTPTGTGITTSENPYEITGLESATYYDFYVQANCGGGDLSTWNGPFTFITSCEVYEADWVDDFETGTIPCWKIGGNEEVETWFLDDGSNSYPANGTYCMMIEKNNFYLNQDQWLISPIFNLSASMTSDLTLRFKWNMNYEWGVYPYDNYDVYLLATTNGGDIWEQLWTEPAVFVTDEWNDEAVSLSEFTFSDNFRFAFRYVGNDGESFFLDTVQIYISTHNEQPISANISAFPNPTTGKLYFTNIESYLIYNLNGTVVLSGKNDEADLSGLPAGSYIAKIQKSGRTHFEKIILIP